MPPIVRPKPDTPDLFQVTVPEEWRWILADPFFIVPGNENTGVPQGFTQASQILAGRSFPGGAAIKLAGWGVGKSGKGMLFDGANLPEASSSFAWFDEDVDIGGFLNMFGTGTHTWVCVFEAANLTGSDRTIMATSGSLSSLSISSSTLRHERYGDGDNMVFFGGPSTDPGLTVIVSTFDASKVPGGRLYLDGEQVAEGFANAPINTLNANFALGADAPSTGKGGSSDGYAGLIYWAGWFQREWTAEEVRRLSNDPFAWMEDEDTYRKKNTILCATPQVSLKVQGITSMTEVLDALPGTSEVMGAAIEDPIELQGDPETFPVIDGEPETSPVLNGIPELEECG